VCVEPRAGPRLRDVPASRLRESAEAIRAETGADVESVVAILDDQSDRDRLVAACPEADILVNNNGGPPPGRFEDWDHASWLAALESNLLAPAMMIRALLPGMKERGFGRIVNITSAMVKTPLAPMALSTTARSGLTALCKSLSREAAAHNVTLNNLLPERIDTDRQVQMANVVSKLRGISYEQARAEQVASIAAGRLGTPDEFADACAFLCSAQAGYISGQNVQLDGGSYAGLI
jgi:3-oxoacyl-[acyl-carrier protein] reductase